MANTTTRMTTGPAEAQIQFDPAGTPGAFVELGYSEEGFSISERPLMQDVFSDRNGGSSGVPVDTQIFGVLGTIRGKLTEFNYTTLKRLKAFASKTALTDGQVPTPGTLLLKDAEQFRLLLEGTKDAAEVVGGTPVAEVITPLNFNVCLFKDAVDFNVGSKVTAVEIVITAYTFIDADDSDKLKLYNRDTVV